MNIHVVSFPKSILYQQAKGYISVKCASKLDRLRLCTCVSGVLRPPHVVHVANDCIYIAIKGHLHVRKP